MASTIRTFIAIPLTNSLAKTVSGFANTLGRIYTEYRWVPHSNLHLTTNFLGDVPDWKVPKVCSLVAAFADRRKPFECSLGRMGAFPKPTRPRILWLGLEQGKQELIQLHYDLEKALEKLHIEPERKRFRPHLTIGRLDERERWPESLVTELSSTTESLPCSLRGSPDFDAAELVVYSSYMDGGDPVHTPMSRAPFGEFGNGPDVP